ncbi:3066_t:CDS:1, partial [Dentiscutata heterogama]
KANSQVQNKQISKKSFFNNDISINNNIFTILNNDEEELILYNLFEDSYISEDEHYEYISEFTVKLYINDQNRTMLPAKQLLFIAQLCIEFHNKIRFQVQDLTNNFELE